MIQNIIFHKSIQQEEILVATSKFVKIYIQCFPPIPSPISQIYATFVIIEALSLCL